MFELTESTAKPLDLANAWAPAWDLFETDDAADARPCGDTYGTARAADCEYWQG